MIEHYLQHVEAAFAEDGPLDAAMRRRGRTYRPSQPQFEYAMACARTFVADTVPGKGAPVTLLEAETGTGKSLGYLVPLALFAAHTGKRGAISTFTLHLLEQLNSTEIPIAIEVAEALTGKRLTHARRVGLRNWLSRPRIKRLQVEILNDPTSDKSLVSYLDGLADFAEAGNTLLEWTAHNGPLPDAIRVGDICLSASAEPGAEEYVEHVARANAADLLIVSHALTAMDLGQYGRLLSAEGAAPIAALVIDEADTLPGVIRSHYQVHLSSLQLLTAALYMKGANRAAFESHIADFKALTDQLIQDVPRTYRQSAASKRMVNLGDGKNGTYRVQFQKVAAGLLTELRRGMKAAQKGGAETDVLELKVFEGELAMFTDCCERMSDYKIPGVSFSPVLAIPAFNVVPFDASRMASLLWRESKDNQETLRSAVVMTSATLDAPGADDSSFTGFMAEIGLNAQYHNVRRDLSGRYAPEDFGRMTFHLSPPHAPRPSRVVEAESESDDDFTNPEWVSYCARTLSHIAGLEGRCLVLANSYRDTQALASAARALGVTPLEHSQGTPLSEAVGRFVETPGSMLISPTAWEGLNLPGLVDHLVVTRLPIQNTSSSFLGMYREVLLSRGKTEAEAFRRIRAIAQNNASRKLKQGLGRGIRAADDRVEVWILDPRFPLPDRLAPADASPHYRRFANAIPVRFRSKPLAATYPKAKLIEWAAVDALGA